VLQTNLPVFRRDAVSDPELLDIAAVTLDPIPERLTRRRPFSEVSRTDERGRA